jgi:hypothetical protein
MTIISPNVGPVATIPAEVVQLTYEVVPWEIDLTRALPPGGGVPTSPTTVFTDVTRLPTQVVALSDAPAITGTGVAGDPYVFKQTVRGPTQLVAGHTYQLLCTFAVGAVTELAVMMLIAVPL